MSERWSNLPSLSSLLPHGLVPSVSISLGFLVVFSGVFGDFALSNKKLLFGFLLVCFGIMWSYGSRAFTLFGYVNERMRRFPNWGNIALFLFFLLLSVLLLYSFLTGELHPWLSNILDL